MGLGVEAAPPGLAGVRPRTWALGRLGQPARHCQGFRTRLTFQRTGLARWGRGPFRKGSGQQTPFLASVALHTACTQPRDGN